MYELPEAALVEVKGKHSRKVNPAIRVLQQCSQTLSLTCHGQAFRTVLTKVSRGEGMLRSIIPTSLSAELPPQLQLSPDCPCKGTLQSFGPQTGTSFWQTSPEHMLQ